MEATLPVPVCQSRRELMGPLDPAPIDDHADLFPNFAEGRHHVMAILAEVLGIKMGHDFREDFGGAVLHGADNREQHATGDAAPGARAEPRVAFEALVACDLTLAQRARGEATALGFAPPACPREGKTPEAGFG